MERKIFKGKCGDDQMYGRLKAVEAYINEETYPSMGVVLSMLGFSDENDEIEELKAEAAEKEAMIEMLKEESEALKKELDWYKGTECTVNGFVEE